MTHEFSLIHHSTKGLLHTPTYTGSSDVPLFIIGDSAYPLKPWLMKPFPQTALGSEKPKRTTTGLAQGSNSCRKHFWKIAAACVLHNIHVCEVHGEQFNDAWLNDIESQSILQPPTTSVLDRSSDCSK